MNAPVLTSRPVPAAAEAKRATVRPRRSVQARLRALGWPGIVGIGLLVMCAAFYLSTLEPAQTRLQETRQSLATLRQELGAAQNANGTERPAAEQLADFYRQFPGEKDLPDRLGRIFAAAQAQGLVLEQGEYKPATDKVGRLMHYDITLPVKGEYPQIRRFLAAVAKDVPTAALDQVEFERQKVGVATLDCKIKLTLYLERRP